MRALDYVRTDGADAAVAERATRTDAAYLGGGTNLLDHMKLGVATPAALIDVSRLPATIAPLGVGADPADDGSLRIGAAVRNSDLAADRRIRRHHPVVARSVLAGASPQIRNMATTGGNLLQRTRCPYFHDVTTPCNKREPGSGCSAIGGYTRNHAVLGASEHCIATHPSDLAVGLAVRDVIVVVQGADGERRFPYAELHRLPGDRPDVDTTLAPGELITALELGAPPVGERSTYRKVRDRASYAFALVSVAAAVVVEDGHVTSARLALGGVAHVPWRATAAEEALVGRPATEATFSEAAEAELASAAPQPGNAFKVPMAQGAIVATLLEVTS